LKGCAGGLGFWTGLRAVDFEAVTEALKPAKITPEHAEVTKIASTVGSFA